MVEDGGVRARSHVISSEGWSPKSSRFFPEQTTKRDKGYGSDTGLSLSLDSLQNMMEKSGLGRSDPEPISTTPITRARRNALVPLLIEKPV